MVLTINSKKHESYTLYTESFIQSDYLEGFRTQVLHHEQIIGEASVYLAPKGLCNEALLVYLDKIELLAVELFDLAQDQKRVAKQIQAHPFAYLTNLNVQPDYQNIGIGSLLLKEVETQLQAKQIPNLYLVNVADTSRDQQKLHHFYTHNYFTYLIPQHPSKPAVMHRGIEL